MHNITKLRAFESLKVKAANSSMDENDYFRLKIINFADPILKFNY